ncbi:MAG TPA: thioredoxin [Candidatus Kryptonia bacterium]|nr:thioredoxin [Candidatus Kryptonia bacterium]
MFQTVNGTAAAATFLLESPPVTGYLRASFKEAIVANVVEVSDGSFEKEVLQSAEPVLIDFWAPWCGPCKAIGPVVEELSTDYSGRLKVVKMNVDDNPQTPSKYGVRGIPNLIIFKGGQVQDQIVGAVPKAHLVKAIERTLS